MRWGLIAYLFVLLAMPFAYGQTTCPDSRPDPKKRYVTTDLNLRDYPGSYGKILLTLPKGEAIYAYRERNGWSQVNVGSINITGWVSNRYLSRDCIEGGGLNRESLPRSQIVGILMSQSKSSYSGSCPCPYNTDRGGRRCGGRSAYSRPGGASPLCYPGDVTNSMINRFRGSR